MGSEKKFILDGYRFDEEADYLKAQKEMRRLSDIKKTNDLREEASLRRVYDVLVESEDFVTPIGLGFLREAQRELIKNPEQKKTMKAIPVKKRGGLLIEKEKKSASLSFDALRLRYRNLKIVLGFMILIIIVIFSVTIFDRTLPREIAREAVLNEYASWKEELVSKENELREREKEIKEKEDALKTNQQGN